MDAEKFARKIICDARYNLKVYLEEDYSHKPRIGISYTKMTFKKILDNFHLIKEEGERKNIYVKNIDMETRCIFYEYKFLE